MKAELATGKGDGEILTWIEQNAPINARLGKSRSRAGISAKCGPDSDAETLEFFTEHLGQFSKAREDVKTWFDLLYLDDRVTFGGKA